MEEILHQLVAIGKRLNTINNGISNGINHLPTGYRT